MGMSTFKVGHVPAPSAQSCKALENSQDGPCPMCALLDPSNTPLCGSAQLSASAKPLHALRPALAHPRAPTYNLAFIAQASKCLPCTKPPSAAHARLPAECRPCSQPPAAAHARLPAEGAPPASSCVRGARGDCLQWRGDGQGGGHRKSAQADRPCLCLWYVLFLMHGKMCGCGCAGTEQ
eukprot:scaffold44622_cov18-Tisochrysis_lutea.AAC.2